MYKELRKKRDKDIYNLKKKGYTFRYIAQKYNITKQRAHQIFNTFIQGVDKVSVDNNLTAG